MYVYSFKVSEYESDDYVEFSASKQIVHFCALGVPGLHFSMHFVLSLPWTKFSPNKKTAKDCERNVSEKHG